MKRQLVPIRNHSRRGLAPLEFVLALPLLLLMAALMVNFGDAGRWKIRGQANARYSATRSLGFRSGEFDPNPRNWPPPASLSEGGDADLNPVDPMWNSDPDITTPAVRGPQVFDPWMGMSIRVKRELEMHAGAHNGNAHTERRYHQAPNAMPNRGRYSFDINQAILDRDWNYGDMGYGSNMSRRSQLWYVIDWMNDEDLRELSSLAQRKSTLENALGQLRSSPGNPFLAPLDEDDEFLIYRNYAPDFIPRPGGCELEADLYRISNQYQNFLDQIRRRPGVMARAFIGMYQAEISRQRGNPPQVPPQPPPPGGEHWTILEQKVQQLQSFLANLLPQYQ